MRVSCTYLGVDDPSDIDFGTYKTLLREKIAAARMGGSDMDSGDISYLTNEFIRIKKIEVPEGQKKKKIDINKFVKKAEEKKKKIQNQHKNYSTCLLQKSAHKNHQSILKNYYHQQ